MFGKLVKYEFKSIGKWYLAINLALIAVALIIGILLGQSAGSISSSGKSLLPMILPLLVVSSLES